MCIFAGIAFPIWISEKKKKKKKKGILVKSVDRFNKFGSIYFVSSKLFEVGGVVLLTPKYFIIFLQ